MDHRKKYSRRSVWQIGLVLCMVLGVCAGLFSGCSQSHKHQWKEATCAEPYTCTICGMTTGGTLAHKWAQPNCVEGRRCTVCGKTEQTPPVHSWEEATCLEPMRCSLCGSTQGEPNGHSWVEATCAAAKHCKVCKETEGEPLDHSWVEATCTTKKHCTACLQTTGELSEHSWSEGSEASAPKCLVCGTQEPLALPASGQVFIGKGQYCISSLTINSGSSKSCYIKLKDTSGRDVFSFFVRAGDSVTVRVPGGTYYVYFSYGTQWYGTEDLFGPQTTYAKDDEAHDFYNYTYTYTLTPVFGCNFTETPVSEDEFM